MTHRFQPAPAWAAEAYRWDWLLNTVPGALTKSMPNCVLGTIGGPAADADWVTTSETRKHKATPRRPPICHAARARRDNPIPNQSPTRLGRLASAGGAYPTRRP